MRINRIARRRYTDAPTPLEPLPRLSAELGGPNIWVKRDDLLGLTGGGNKTRKLEFLVADALRRGADTLITCGAVQSNHCRLTLAAAVREGLRCRLVLEEKIPDSFTPDAGGNLLLFELLGAEELRVVPAGSDTESAMAQMVEELAAVGRKAVALPLGGSNPLGAMGYVACARELVAQSFHLDMDIQHLICATGSCGTHAGLLVGLDSCSADVPVTGISISRSAPEQEALIRGLADGAAQLLEVSHRVPDDRIQVMDDYVGEGYAIPTAGMVAAVKLVARTEGLLLDPVYTGKAMAGLIDLIRQGRFGSHENVVFLHSGGSPALHAYRSSFTE